MSTPTAYQKVVTQYDVTEAGVASIFYSVWDNTDDILPITLPAITGGTVALVGLNGIWIEDDWDYAGGTLSIGPTTIAGLPAGILSVVGNLCAVIINDRAWTAAERAGVVAWGKARGAPGVFGLGAELVTNGTFDTDVSGWSNQSGGVISWSAGTMRVTPVFGDNLGFGEQQTTTVAGEKYLLKTEIVSATAVRKGRFYAGTGPALTNLYDSGSQKDVGSYAVAISSSTTSTWVGFGADTFTTTNGVDYVEYDNISLRKLELLP